MAKPELLSEKPITMVDLKEELEAIKKRDKELGFRSKKTEEYLSQFVTLSPKKAEEIRKKLEDQKISRLKEEFIVKIMDTLPTTVDELKTLLQGYVVSINQDDMKKIVAVVNEFTAEKK
jgi:DNA-directed RNA polymerase subunit F